MCCGQAAGYSGLLLGSPVILYEIVAFVLPGLTRSERRFLAPIVLGSSVLFYAGLAFSYTILVPAALTFFVTYAENVVESIWSIDQYFEFVLVLLFSTGLAFQVSPRPHQLVAVSCVVRLAMGRPAFGPPPGCLDASPWHAPPAQLENQVPMAATSQHGPKLSSRFLVSDKIRRLAAVRY